MNLTLLIQFASAFSIFGVCFIGGIVPVRLTRWKPETLSYANCLSAGILLGKLHQPSISCI